MLMSVRSYLSGSRVRKLTCWPRIGIRRRSNRGAVYAVTSGSVRRLCIGWRQWRANRRNVESLDPRREMQSFQKEAAHLTLIANLANAAIEEASLRAQIAATRRIIDLQQERLSRLECQLAHGVAAGADIFLRRSSPLQQRQTLPDLSKDASPSYVFS